MFKDLIKKVYEDLKSQFEEEYSKYIDDWKNGFLNKFYDGEKSRYRVELDKYIESNAFGYIEKYYKDNNISDTQKNELFKEFYKSGYKNFVLKSNTALISDGFNDTDFFSDICFYKDFKTFSILLNQTKNFEEVHNNLLEIIFYQNLTAWNFNTILKYLLSNKDMHLDLYDLIFNDLTSSDKFGYNILNVLQYTNIITPSNILSILNNIYVHGDRYIDINNGCSKLKIMTDNIINGNIKYIGDENDYFNVELLIEINNSENKEELIEKIVLENYERYGKFHKKKCKVSD